MKCLFCGFLTTRWSTFAQKAKTTPIPIRRRRECFSAPSGFTTYERNDESLTWHPCSNQPMPHLPLIAVVTPCQHDGVRFVSQGGLTVEMRWISNESCVNCECPAAVDGLAGPRPPIRPNLAISPSARRCLRCGCAAPEPSTTRHREMISRTMTNPDRPEAQRRCGPRTSIFTPLTSADESSAPAGRALQCICFMCVRQSC